MVPGEALLHMHDTKGIYDKEILAAFQQTVLDQEVKTTGELYLEDLRPGLIAAQDIETRDGILLASKGQELSDACIARIRNFAKAYGLDEPIRMILPDQPDQPDQEENADPPA
jgi:hypothetical protein